jgi:hypothetical protein
VQRQDRHQVVELRFVAANGLAETGVRAARLDDDRKRSGGDQELLVDAARQIRVKRERNERKLVASEASLNLQHFGVHERSVQPHDERIDRVDGRNAGHRKRD